jgi:hypothetical protein
MEFRQTEEGREPKYSVVVVMQPNPLLVLTWELRPMSVFYFWTGQAGLKCEPTLHVKMANKFPCFIAFTTQAGEELNCSSARK